jgi:hypothetical protein
MSKIVSRDFLKILWKKIFLVVFISTIGGFISKLILTPKIQEFYIKIEITEAKENIFQYYDYISSLPGAPKISKNELPSIANSQENFNTIFYSNFLSFNNFENFLKQSQSKEINNFKQFFKSKNYDITDYFKHNNKIGAVTENKKKHENKYFFIYPKELDGRAFLIEYLNFTKNQTIEILRMRISKSIIDKVLLYEKAFDLAKKIGIEEPVYKNLDSQIYPMPFVDDLFYKGSKVLLHEMTYYKNLLQKLSNEKVDLNNLFYLSPSISISKSSNTYFLIGFIFGFILCLLIIFYKRILKILSV